MELAKLFPIYRVENGRILSRQGDVTLGFRAQLPEIFTLSSRDYEAYHQAWVRALRTLPAGCVLHKQDWFTRERYQADFSKPAIFSRVAVNVSSMSVNTSIIAATFILR